MSRAHWSRIDWVKYDGMLGMVADIHIARVIGCTKQAVANRRAILGIQSWRRKKEDNLKWRNKFKGCIKDLGRVPAHKLAKKLKRTPAEIKRWMRDLGIKMMRVNNKRGW